MPIVLPTRTELARMGWRQREQVARNLPALLADIASACDELGVKSTPTRVAAPAHPRALARYVRGIKAATSHPDPVIAARRRVLLLATSPEHVHAAWRNAEQEAS